MPEEAAKAQTPLEYIRVILDRETGKIEVDTNMRIISDQVGLLDTGKMFIQDRWRFEQAQQLAKRGAPLIEIPNPRRSN